MEHAGHGADHDHASRGSRVEAELASLIDVYGLQIIEQPEQIRLLLAQACSDGTRHIDAILVALSAKVPQRLRAAQDDRSLPGQLRRSVQLVQRHASLDAAPATWAVRAWAHALALPTTSLDGPTQETMAPAATQFAAVVTPLAARTAVEATPVADGVDPKRREPFFQDDASLAKADPPPPSFVEPRHPEPAPADDPVIVAPMRTEPDDVAPPRRPMRFVVAASLVVVAAVLFFGIDAWRHLQDTNTPRTETKSIATAPARPPVSVPPPEAVQAPPPVEAPAIAPPVAPVEATPAPPVETTVTSRPAIQRIDVPRIVEGAPFAVAIRVGGNARDIASVERRLIDGHGAWSQLASSLPAKALRRSGADTLLVPFRAMDAPARATFEFSVVDRDGSRSEPQRATLAVTETGVASVAGPCTPSTCGAVASVESLEGVGGTSAAYFEIRVRMDDGAFRMLPASYRLQIGTRVRLVGNRFVPAEGSGR